MKNSRLSKAIRLFILVWIALTLVGCTVKILTFNDRSQAASHKLNEDYDFSILDFEDDDNGSK